MSEAVQINTADVEQALEHDGEFFIQFFLEDELTFPVPKFHVDVFQLMTVIEVLRFVCAIPRDHAKTTLAKLACVWYFLFSDYRFIVYLSNTATIAIPAVNDVVAFMESDNFRNVFGELEWFVRQEGTGFYKFKFRNKVCILRALGAGQQVRGINVDNQRPQLAIVDDLEDNDNIATEQLYRKLKTWFYGPFRKCLDKFHNKIIHLGNMLYNQSLLNEHCKSNFWYSRHYGCLLADKTALWEDAWSIEKLQQDYAEYCERGLADVWFAEMMNLPVAGGRGLIAADEITYKPYRLPEDIEFGFITIDLAISEETWAHKTVVAVHGWTGEWWQIVEYEGYTGIDPVALFAEVIRLSSKWHIRVVGIEDVAYQASLKYVFAHFCLEHQIMGMQFVPLHSYKQRKIVRLAPWAALLKSGVYCLNEGDFAMTQELISYDPTKKNNVDDYIDCASYGPQMMDNYMGEIQTQFNYTPGEVQTCYQIAAI